MLKTSSAAYIVPPQPGQPDAWTTETQGHGKQAITVSPRPPEDIEDEVLAALVTLRVVTRQRLLTVDGRPVEIAESVYPVSIAEGTALTRPAPIKGGAVRLLADLGWAAARVVEDVGAVAAEQRHADLLHVPVGSPLLAMYRTSFSDDGTPFEYLRTLACDGRRQRYVLELA